MKTASPSAQHKWQTWPSAVKVCCSVKQARTRLITHKWSSRPVMFIKQDGAPPKDTPSATQQTPSIPGQPLPPTPAAAVGAVVQTQQHRVKSGMQQLAGSLSSSNANLCHAALQQMQDALLSMYTSNAANTQVLHMAGVYSESEGRRDHQNAAHHLYYMLAGLHEKIALTLLTTGDSAWLTEYMAMLPAQLDEAVYTKWIKVCGQHRNAAALSHVVEARTRAGHANNKFTVTRIMAAWQKAGQIQNALTTFEEAVADGIADLDVYNAAIAACMNSKQSMAAHSIFATMTSQGIKPSLHTFHSLLKDTSQLKAAGLRDLYSQMLSTKGLVLTEVSFHYVFRAANQCRGWPASWLFQVLADMPRRNVTMNSYILTAFFQACCWVFLTAQELEAAFAAAASYRATQPATAFVYTALLTFCAKKAPDRALDVWHALQEDKIEVTAHLLSSLFAACAASELPDMLELAEGCHMQLEGLWNKICGKGKTTAEERDMLQAHNALLHVYASHSRVSKAKQLYAAMQERGPDVDDLSAASLIAAYAKVGDSQSALQRFDEMRLAGLQPTQRCMTSLLAACARARDLTAAHRVFRGMGTAGNVPAYTALMDACLKEGSPAACAEAFQVFDEMKANRLQPTATTYGCLLMVCAREGKVEKAFELYREAYSRGVLATDECHNILITICADAGRTDEALELVKALASKHGHMEQPALNSLVRSLLHMGQVPRALRMLSIMTNMGLKPYRSTIDALIAGCARDSNSQQASAFYWDLRGHGGDASKKSGSALIISLCKAGQAWEALKVYEDMTAPPPPPMPTSHEEQAGNWFSNVQTASTVLTSPEAHANSSFQQAASPRSATPNKGNVQTATDATSHVSAGTLHSPDQSSQQSRFRTLSADGSPAEGPSMTNRAFDDANAHNTVTNTPSQPKPVGRAAANQLHAEQLNEQATAGANISETRSTDDHSAPSHAPDMQQATSANSERPHAAAAIQQPPNTAPQVVSGSPLQLVRPTRRSSIPREGVEAQQSTAATTAKGPAVRSGHGTTSQSSPGPNGSEQRVGEVAGDSSGGRLELHSSTRLSQRVTFPSISATAALVHAFALAGNFHQCHRLYQQLQRDRKGLAGLTHTHRAMWESTIETACRAGQVDWALQVFDDWKSASMSYMFVHSAQHSAVKFPALSNVTLAFLEACCRGSEEHAWRVYDVCAAMRQQRERKAEAALARPFKKSHHVADFL